MSKGKSSDEFLALPLVITNDWLFKVSSFNGKIMIVAFNPIFNWSHVRFFDKEHEVKNWTEYLMMQSKDLMTQK